MPSVYFDPSSDDYRDWMEWCVPYLTICLRRPQFDDMFDIAASPWHDAVATHSASPATRQRRHNVNETKKLLSIVPAAAGPPPMNYVMKTAGFLKTPPRAPAGAWITSYRMHVHLFKHTCLFGCPTIESKRGTDDIARCIRCPRMWSHLCLPRGQVSPNVITRLGLNGEQIDDDAIPRSIARLAVAFKVYNFLRIQNAVNIGSASINEARAPVHPSYDTHDKNKVLSLGTADRGAAETFHNAAALGAVQVALRSYLGLASGDACEATGVELRALRRLAGGAVGGRRAEALWEVLVYATVTVEDPGRVALVANRIGSLTAGLNGSRERLQALLTIGLAGLGVEPGAHGALGALARWVFWVLPVCSVITIPHGMHGPHGTMHGTATKAAISRKTGRG
ncbi:unnamed protein product [Prorocentrum cordatum]|uniref:Peroxisomal membrane protein PEX16 n=1 Tax=Prorocentrum cordatum TaxID=2364126 RepID=A0ABN9VAS8_9DINO|nr:unnamed protein product [Polarella glacialis]